MSVSETDILHPENVAAGHADGRVSFLDPNTLVVAIYESEKVYRSDIRRWKRQIKRELQYCFPGVEVVRIDSKEKGTCEHVSVPEAGCMTGLQDC